MTDRSILQLTTNRGHRLQAFANDSITSEIRDSGVYDQWTLLAIEHLLSNMNADICLDVGANIGNHAVVIAQHCRQLHAFEPVPFIFEVLQANLQNNADNARAHCVALSDENSVATIHIDPGGNLGKSTMLSSEGLSSEGLSSKALSSTPLSGESSDSGLEESNATTGSIEITAVCGDQQVTDLDGSIDFIKIDVEGFEPRVIKGLQQTIRKHQPVLLLEWNSSQTRKGFDDADLFAMPLDGYQYYSLTHRRSKQVSGRGLKGALKRALVKVSRSDDWCVHPFNAELSYPNVLMFPRKWQALAEGLPVN